MAAPTGQGLPELEEALLLQAEMMELQVRAAALLYMCMGCVPGCMNQSCTARPI